MAPVGAEVAWCGEDDGGGDPGFAARTARPAAGRPGVGALGAGIGGGRGPPGRPRGGGAAPDRLGGRRLRDPPPLAIGAAVLRYRLYDLDRIISRTLAYGLLALILALGYSLVVLGLGQLLGQGSSLVVAAATLTVAAKAPTDPPP